MATLSLFTGPLNLDVGLNLAQAVQPINATVFANATITSARGDIHLVLYDSTVTSGGSSASIALGDNERRSLINQVDLAANFSKLTFAFVLAGIRYAAPITMTCMSACDTTC